MKKYNIRVVAILLLWWRCKQCTFDLGREHFIKFGACEKDMISYVRKPFNSELHGIDI